MIVVLREIHSSDVDGIITTKTTSKSKIQNIIDEVKDRWEEDESPDDLFTLIVNALPKDCKVYAIGTKNNTVWY